MKNRQDHSQVKFTGNQHGLRHNYVTLMRSTATFTFLSPFNYTALSQTDDLLQIFFWVLLQTRELKLLPKSVHGLIKIRRTCRRKIHERLCAVSGDRIASFFVFFFIWHSYQFFYLMWYRAVQNIEHLMLMVTLNFFFSFLFVLD